MFVILMLFLSVLFVTHTNALNVTHRQFPDYFLFGAATASYQIEGAWNVSDKGENIWDRLTHTSNVVWNGDTGDVACDSYHQYTRDVEMLKELGVDFYRFSLSWSRILPTGFDNKISQDGIAYYNNLIDLLLANGITPAITLYHWDLPQPLQDIGGWPNPLMEKYFEDFARVCFEAFGDRVKEWLTLNEPILICLGGYGDKDKAPALNFRGIAEYLCGHTLLKAHAKVFHLYDEEYRSKQNGRIGLTYSGGWHEPEDLMNPAHWRASDTALQFEFGWFTNPIFSKTGDYPKIMKENIAKKSQEQGYSSSRLPSFTPEEVEYIKGTSDFFGLNHYTSSMVRPANSTDKFPEHSYWEDAGIVNYQPSTWPTSPSSSWLKVVPWGFTKNLLWIMDTYDNPEVVIMENGYSDFGGTSDADRVSYYHQYINAMLNAMDEGCHITGYTAWSLVDNFEWMEGYRSKFGLYSVDFENPSRPRTTKDSAKWYMELIRTRTLAINEN